MKFRFLKLDDYDLVMLMLKNEHWDMDVEEFRQVVWNASSMVTLDGVGQITGVILVKKTHEVPFFVDGLAARPDLGDEQQQQIKMMLLAHVPKQLKMLGVRIGLTAVPKDDAATIDLMEKCGWLKTSYSLVDSDVPHWQMALFVEAPLRDDDWMN